MSRSWNARRYLALCGCFPRWSLFVLTGAAGLAIAERLLGGRVEAGLPLYLVILPIASGTALLTRAREGRLDLLFLAGASRSDAWRAAMTRAVAVPVIGAVLLSPLMLPRIDSFSTVASIAFRAFAVGLLTGGVAFAIGLVEPKYLAGVLWLAIRGAFALSPATFKLLARVDAARHGGAVLDWWEALLVGFAVPEMVLDFGVPLWVAGVLLLAGVAALGVSWLRIARSDLSGKRQE
jgi:hypothetical protein